MEFGLVIKDSIFIQGEDGKYEIQLCFGDITKLPKKDEVDVVLISAFPGSYPERGTTLMAALKEHLDISVRNLFQNKAEDLRKDFSCWISQPLPEHLPFRRLLCFEQARSVANFANRVRNPDQQLGDVFRAFTTLFSDNDAISVISPLLSTGGQGQPWEKMLVAMVTSCAAWMRAGLPLKLLKIVVFVPNKELLSHPENELILETFSQLKSTLDTVEDTKKTISPKHDAMLMYSNMDKELVKKFLSYMKEVSSDLKLIITEIEWLNISDEGEEEEKKENIQKWSLRLQEQMLDVKKVVCFLSPYFLSSKECIDSYNLAMCLSRKWHNSLLAPVYLDTMPYVPTYLTLTQWIDCRKKDRDLPEINRLRAGASHLCSLLSAPTGQLTIRSAAQFDVFISYSHRDTARVQDFVAALSRANPKLRIFIDKEGLKTGFAWQATLYSALSNSSLVVAFASEHYLKSKMCNEEFAIASSQLALLECDTRLVLVQLEVLEGAQLDPMFLTCPSISTAEGDEKAQKVLVGFVERCFGEGFKKKSGLRLDHTLRKARRDFHARFWEFDDTTRKLKFLGPPLERTQGKLQQVIICCHPDELERVELLRKILLKLSSIKGNIFNTSEVLKTAHPTVEVDIVTEDSSYAHSSIESADMVLLMLNASFCTQPSTQSLLHVVLALSRSGKCRLQAVIVSSLPRRPSVLHLLPAAISLEDPVWHSYKNLFITYGYPLENEKETMSWIIDMKFSISSQLALRIAAEWVLYCLSSHPEDDMANVTALQNIKGNGYFRKICPVQYKPQLLIRGVNEIPKSITSNDTEADEDAKYQEVTPPPSPTEESLPTIFKYERLLGNFETQAAPPPKKSNFCSCL